MCFVDYDDEENPIVIFQYAGGNEVLEDLQLQPNVEIFSLAKKLLEQFYPGGEHELQKYGDNMEEQNDSDNIEF